MRMEERKQLFQAPTREYQGKPFWSWNGKLEEAELLRQADIIKQMGFGGYFMHSRTGLETEYLGEEWFELINSCADHGQQENMEAWLYDEDRWPSGSAGGIVTKDMRYRAAFIEGRLKHAGFLKTMKWNKSVIAVFACRFEQDILRTKRRIYEGDTLNKGERLVVFRVKAAVCNDNYNGYCYADTMNRQATERFIQVTHEKYKEKCGERLGERIQGIFTDEPHRGPCFTGFSGGGINKVPYTPQLFDAFLERFGYDLRDYLPELFFRETEQGISKVTWQYYELCQQLFLENFAIPILEWCRANNLKITGHVLHEDSLSSQTIMQGSLMRYYEYMDYPGIDILGEYNQCFWVAKQVVSVARQLHKEWILSELDGCTGWQMGFTSYKHIGDWQALFGINLRCPHLSWYTMKGEAKRDYPASILHQSPWYQEYHYLEDYYSRIHAATHGGTPECELLVINPVESVWARSYAGAYEGLTPLDGEIQRLEQSYEKLFHWLSGSRIDFDYGDEDILARHGRVDGRLLRVGEATYKKVLVSGADMLRSSTVELLKSFVQAGGQVIFAGELPGYVDGEASAEPDRLAGEAVRIPFEEADIAGACASGREVSISGEGNTYIYAQSKVVEGGRIIMLLNTNREKGYEGLKVKLGPGKALEWWNPRDGKIYIPRYIMEEGCIGLELTLEAGGERLYFLRDTPGVAEDAIVLQEEKMQWKERSLPEHYTYRLTEENICVLDYVSITGTNGISIPGQEVLKADRALRDILKIPYRGGEMLQPWYSVKYKGGDKNKLAELTLEYGVDAAIIPSGTMLVVEDMEHIRSIRLNGCTVPKESTGKWIDICFDKIRIPDGAWKKGRNVLEIDMDYYGPCGLEAVYLLGDFGVELKDGLPVLGELPQYLTPGDITPQGLPFYSGSVLYEIPRTKAKRSRVEDIKFSGSLVKLHGAEDRIIAFEPYEGEVEALTAIEVVLTRRNTFGPLHQNPKRCAAYGPENFMTTGQGWTCDYQLYEQGLLSNPVLRELSDSQTTLI